ncbi:MAG: cation diffusion facilitator family transporter [Thermoanaerobaculia bacterium]|nr:cation diffusion facilitator family transporter [Thermoanaerobaculia bacterium]
MAQHAHNEEIDLGKSSVRSKLIVGTAATLVFVAVELVVGIYANALALIGDALHNLTDAVALALALAVVILEKKPPTAIKSFGYQRAGILVAFINAAALVAFTIFLLVEAWRRFRNPEPVDSFWMMIVAALGIALNLAITLWLRRESEADLNIRAAVLHLFGDTLSSAGVIVAAGLMLWTGVYIWDPVITVVIAALILWSAWDILRETVNLLLEGTPRGIDPDEVSRALASQSGVYGVHHLHIWAIAPTKPALSCHLMLGDVSLKSTGEVLSHVSSLLSEQYGIVHTTIQFEHAGCPVDDPHCLVDPSELAEEEPAKV